MLVIAPATQPLRVMKFIFKNSRQKQPTTKTGSMVTAAPASRTPTPEGAAARWRKLPPAWRPTQARKTASPKSRKSWLAAAGMYQTTDPILPSCDSPMAAISGPPARPMRSVVLRPGMVKGIEPTITPSTMPRKIGMSCGRLRLSRLLPNSAWTIFSPASGPTAITRSAKTSRVLALGTRLTPARVMRAMVTPARRM